MEVLALVMPTIRTVFRSVKKPKSPSCLAYIEQFATFTIQRKTI